MKLKLPNSVYNWVSVIGAMIALISFFMIFFLFVISSLFEGSGTYLGLIIFIILPAFLVLGLILIPVGMLIKRKKAIVPGVSAEETWPVINLNESRNRNAFFIFAIGTAIFLFASAVGSYEAFHYSESVEFCGEICHGVMKPEFTAYQFSAHARVSCVECHVGTGADWFVKSKLSGLYQVYAVIMNNYPRPIPTPVANLRPARETCEECHWPEKFYARKLQLERHYLSDEENTEWDINMTIKIGAPFSALGLQEGIHWHINPSVKIEYIATDSTRQTIPWIRYTNRSTGEVHEYMNQDDPIDIEEISNYEIREMECIDCHNRPSHDYKPPAFFIDNAFTAGALPRGLPELKLISMEILGEEFETTDSAMMYIDKTVRDFYENNYPEIYSEEEESIAKAIETIQNGFQHNIFPEMKVRWDVYPNNIGHVEFNGCFRCHDDLHISEEGRVVQKDCNQCHVINSQGNPDNLMIAAGNESLEFKHPVDIDEVWKESLCTDCHTGLSP